MGFDDFSGLLELEMGIFGGFGSLWWWVRGGGLGLGLSVGLGLCGGGCVVVAWVWVFPWVWVFVVVRGGGLGLLIRWVWVFVVVGAWWWPGVVDSVGLGLCRGLGWLNRWLGVVVGSPEVELGLGGGAVPFGLRKFWLLKLIFSWLFLVVC
uniref:Uncharacterized protein n=1 Tax=Fagus sylvatica TaxID=28930 RepID=A0A2N9IR21_FAGSY